MRIKRTKRQRPPTNNAGGDVYSDTGGRKTSGDAAAKENCQNNGVLHARLRGERLKIVNGEEKLKITTAVNASERHDGDELRRGRRRH